MASASLTPPPPRDCSNFTIAVICALPLEAECVYDALDHVWKDKKYANAPGDHNAYTLGVIGDHNVVVVHMPGMGTTRAAYAVSDLKTSFPNIELALVVGVCGAMPYTSDHKDILLGDVIISKALVQYTFGKQYAHGFERKTGVLDSLGAPSEKILNLLAKLETRQYMQDIQANTATALRAIQQKSSKTQHPGVDNDILYHSSYVHQHRSPKTCDTCTQGDKICKVAVEAKCEDLECDSVMRVTRRRQLDPLTAQPTIHVGVMGSGDTVMKSGHHRDALAQHEGIVAVEMEGAGIWRYGPSLVIKGVCDYADSHKRKGWQRYAAAAAAACAKAFLMEWTSEQGSSTSVDRASVNEHFVVSRQRVKRLFGRDEELAKIASYFDRDANDGEPRMMVLQAMGGQGKSQIALKYCHRSRDKYRGVFWVNASSTATTTQSLVSIADILDRTATEALPDDDAKAAFAIRTLERWQQRWLMVFDSCDDRTTFFTLQDKFLPQFGRASILMTSRHKGLAGLCELVEIPPMPQEAAVQLLLHRYHGVNPSDYLLESTLIVNRLGNLALAIDQASAFMQDTHLPINKLDTFLPKYFAQRQKVLQHTSEDFWQYTKIGHINERDCAISAFTTWEMSFQQLLASETNRDHVGHFLTLSAFFGQTTIDESLFGLHWLHNQPTPTWTTVFTAPEVEIMQKDSIAQSDAASDLSSASEQAHFDDFDRSWQSDQFWNIIRQAFRMSLLQSITPADEEWDACFLLHPLIRDWLQLRLGLEERRAYTREAADVLVSSILTHTVEDSDAQIKAMILLHMDAVLVCDGEFFNKKARLGQDISTCECAHWFASFYHDQGKYSEAEQMYRKIVQAQEKVPGSECRETLRNRNNLALVLRYRGKYGEAEQMHRMVVQAQERMLGSEHPDTLTSRNNLATVLNDQGKHSEAEYIHRQDLEVTKRVLGSEHPDTLSVLCNLATILSDQGKHDEAEHIHRQELEVAKRVLGSEHPNTLVSMNNLGIVLRHQNKYDEAEDIHRQELEIIKRVLGSEHPETLTSMSNLATLLRCQDKQGEAEQMFHIVVESRKRVLGSEHPTTLIDMNNLALVLNRQGKHDEAERICRVVVEAQKRVIGSKHPDALSVMNNLANALNSQGKSVEAETIQLQVVKSSLAVLGLQHHAIETYLHTLEHIWADQGREESQIESMTQNILADASGSQL